MCKENKLTIDKKRMKKRNDEEVYQCHRIGFKIQCKHIKPYDHIVRNGYDISWGTFDANKTKRNRTYASMLVKKRCIHEKYFLCSLMQLTNE